MAICADDHDQRGVCWESAPVCEGETHARTVPNLRNLETTIDESLVQVGTNVISRHIAKYQGYKVAPLDMKLTCQFNRLGVQLKKETHRPFHEIVLKVDLTTDATPQQIGKTNLRKNCPIAKVIGGNGTTITENRNVQPL